MNYHSPIILILMIVLVVYCINLNGYYWEIKDKYEKLFVEYAKLKDKIKSDHPD